jgi:uncharacterized membrane protein YfcA
MAFDFTNIVLLIFAAALAGAVNAAAGGGSLISFPVLLLVGLPAISANVTNTVALCPGYLGGTVGYRDELQGQGGLMRPLTVVSAIGAVIGVVLLQVSSPDTFRSVVPFLLLIACSLLAFQKPLAAWIFSHHAEDGTGGRLSTARNAGTMAAAAYGSYFGAALGVLMLAILGLLVDDSLQRLNALKSYLSLVVNVIGAALFAIVAPVHWSAVAVMVPASLLGGRGGAVVARHIPAPWLRGGVATIGVIVAILLIVGA